MSELSYRKYVGIPFESGGRDFSGIDCYGLAILIYKEEKDVSLWDYATYTMSDYSKGNYFLSNYHKNWDTLGEEDLQELDVLLFTTDPDLPNIPTHIAVYVGENKMIHCMQGIDTYICKFKGGPMKQFFHSAYRYKGKSN
jgi:cell wall-associated NlpC family hydrolase